MICPLSKNYVWDTTFSCYATSKKPGLDAQLHQIKLQQRKWSLQQNAEDKGLLKNKSWSYGFISPVGDQAECCSQTFLIKDLSLKLMILSNGWSNNSAENANNYRFSVKIIT